MMHAKVINLYSNQTGDNQKLKSDHGQSFLIEIEQELVLYDTGLCSKILLHNMREQSISPDSVTKLVISHGHLDHTGGLPGFIENRNSNHSIPLFAHPAFQEHKIYKVLGLFKKSLSCPSLTANQKRRIKFRLSSKPQKVATSLKTSGEIMNRKEMHKLEANAKHIENDKYAVDPVADDLSLILSAKKGAVIIAGCSHAGILNICEHVKQTSNQKIHAIIGGTHMVRYTEADVKHVATSLLEKYDNPDLYLNHCTDYFPDPFVRKTKATSILKRELSLNKVKDCFVGSELKFEL